jgi:phosphonate transport system substrate-binding protein
MCVKGRAARTAHIGGALAAPLAMTAHDRRQFLAALCAAAAGRVHALPEAGELRVGLTPVFLDNQFTFLNDWRGYLAARLQRRVRFVQRGSYRDIIGLLQQGHLDFAWVCGYPFVRNTRHMRLLAVPLYRGQPRYQSYLIVPAADRHTRALPDLRGKVFAYSDPDSNSGYLFPVHSLLRLHEAPASFFGRSFFTYGHRKVVDAVGVALAQGGAVDGYVWDTLQLLHPEVTSRTRIVERSPEFGFPPFVAASSVAPGTFAAMQSVLLGMSADADGRLLLQRLNLDGFVAGSPALYDSVRAMAQLVEGT